MGEIRRCVKLFRGACGSKFLDILLPSVRDIVKLFRGACGSKYSLRKTTVIGLKSSSFAELVDLNSAADATLPFSPVKLFRGACGSKSNKNLILNLGKCQALSRSLWI